MNLLLCFPNIDGQFYLSYDKNDVCHIVVAKYCIEDKDENNFYV